MGWENDWIGFSRRAPRTHARERQVSSLAEVLSERAAREPDALSHVFVQGEREPAELLTYGELGARVAACAGRLHAAALAAGDAGGDVPARVLLLLEPGLDYVVAFHACLWAGLIAVPALPMLERAQSIVRDAGATIVVYSSATKGLRAALKPGGARPLTWVPARDAEGREVLPAPRVVAHSGQLALLQYTSGSTGTPRGVEVSHGNMLHLLHLTEAVQGYGPDTRLAGWLPPHHDLGLIGGVLQPIYSGFPAALMSPLAFLARPLSWLRLVSDFQATTTGAPTFAFGMSVRRTSPEQRAGLRLACIDTLVCAGEPIRPDLLDAFADAFAPAGFARGALQPAYGLAEATLEATIAPRGSGLLTRWFYAAELSAGRLSRLSRDGEGVRLASSGRAVQDVRVVDPLTRREQPERRIGEIWVRGPAVASGYWGAATETRASFGESLATGASGFLRTGDLGAFVDGELFVTGRMKDLLILHGQNFYPQDIEHTVSSHPDLRPDCAVAFAVDGGGREQLVVVAEARPAARPRLASVLDEVARQIKRAHRLRADHIALLAPRSVLRTTSGKLQRSACRAAFLAGQFEVWASTETGQSDLGVQVEGAAT